MLDENENCQDIYIEPPDALDLTDEDSGDEDLDGTMNPDKMSGRQLSAPAEMRPMGVQECLLSESRIN